jgi:hypothetical protein
VGVFTIGALSNWYLDPAFAKPPFRAIGELLQAEACGSEPIVRTRDGAFLILLHYAPKCEHLLPEGDPGPELPLQTYQLFGGRIKPRDELPGASFWLVVALDNSIEFQVGVAEWIHHHYYLTRQQSHDSIVVRRYTNN